MMGTQHDGITNWNQVNARARKVERRRENRIRQNNLAATTHLRRDRRRDKRFAFTVVNQGQLSFLFDDMHDLATATLNSRKKINAKRRRDARKLLDEVSELRIIRHSTHGATIVMKSRKYGDFYIPIREADCQVIDTWFWMTRLESWEVEVAFELMDVYDFMNHKQLQRLFKLGGVTMLSQRIGVLLIKLDNENKCFSVCPLEPPTPQEEKNTNHNALDETLSYKDIIEEWLHAA